MTQWSKHPQAMRDAVQRATDLKFRMITDDEMPDIERGPEPEPDQCRCEKPEGHTLAVESGGIDIRHTACGKQPWFMFLDWNESVEMAPIPINVQVVTCDSPHYDQMGCDCGPEITLTQEGN